MQSLGTMSHNRNFLLFQHLQDGNNTPPRHRLGGGVAFMEACDVRRRVSILAEFFVLTTGKGTNLDSRVCVASILCTAQRVRAGWTCTHACCAASKYLAVQLLAEVRAKLGLDLVSI